MASDPTLTRKEPKLGPAPAADAPPRPRVPKGEAAVEAGARPRAAKDQGAQAVRPDAKPEARPDPKRDDAPIAARTPHPKPLPPSKMPQIRLLPVTIFVAVLMLSVKVNDIWRGISLTTQSRAQQAATPPQRPNQTAATPPAQGAAAAAQAQTQPVGAPPAARSSPPPARPGAPAVTTPSADGSEATFTQTEIDVLQKLAVRRSELESRAKELDGRDALLKAAESRIDKKITEMKTLQGTIEGLLRQYNDQEDTKMKSLVKIYENMKPKDAAKIFEQLDMPIMLDVIERMKEAKVAPIMAEMDAGKAKSLTSELAHRRQIPVPKPQPQ